MNCPTCLHHMPDRQESPELFFEICPRCGVVWIDFGGQRPRLYASVESQAARWDNLRQLLAHSDSSDVDLQAG